MSEDTKEARCNECKALHGWHGYGCSKHPSAKRIKALIDTAHAAGVREGAEAEREKWEAHIRGAAKIWDDNPGVANEGGKVLRAVLGDYAKSHPHPAPVDPEEGDAQEAK